MKKYIFGRTKMKKMTKSVKFRFPELYYSGNESPRLVLKFSGVFSSTKKTKTNQMFSFGFRRISGWGHAGIIKEKQ